MARLSGLDKYWNDRSVKGRHQSKYYNQARYRITLRMPLPLHQTSHAVQSKLFTTPSTIWMKRHATDRAINGRRRTATITELLSDSKSSCDTVTSPAVFFDLSWAPGVSNATAVKQSGVRNSVALLLVSDGGGVSSVVAAMTDVSVLRRVALKWVAVGPVQRCRELIGVDDNGRSTNAALSAIGDADLPDWRWSKSRTVFVCGPCFDAFSCFSFNARSPPVDDIVLNMSHTKTGGILKDTNR